jgi:hypothetical protein
MWEDGYRGWGWLNVVHFTSEGTNESAGDRGRPLVSGVNGSLKDHERNVAYTATIINLQKNDETFVLCLSFGD